MLVNIITNTCNGVGLERDYRILKEIIEGFGHEVRGVMCYEPSKIGRADINIFCELVRPDLFGYALENWLVPNSEWYFQHWNKHLPYFRRILLKTPHAKSVFAILSPESIGAMNVIGFESRDLCDGTVPREKKFLHVAGKSSHKNTQAVMLAWLMGRPKAHLTMVSEHQENIGTDNVTFIKRASEEELKVLMNSHIFHLMPSAYEGWGHVIHEGMGCGAVVLTTATPPMCQWGARDLLIDGWGDRCHNQILLTKVDPREVLKKVNQAMELPDEKIAELSKQARQKFLSDNKTFRDSLADVFREYA